MVKHPLSKFEHKEREHRFLNALNLVLMLHPAWGCLIIPGEALGNAFVAIAVLQNMLKSIHPIH